MAASARPTGSTSASSGSSDVNYEGHAGLRRGLNVSANHGRLADCYA